MKMHSESVKNRKIDHLHVENEKQPINIPELWYVKGEKSENMIWCQWKVENTPQHMSKREKWK